MIKKLIFLFLAGLLIINLVHAESVDGKDFVEKIIQDLKNDESVQKFISFFKTKLGFSESGFFDGTGFWGHFAIGFFAGLILYIFNSIFTYINKKFFEGKSRNPFSKGVSYWINLISGSIGKIVVLGGVYAVVTEIPVVNRVVQTITLDYLLEGFMVKTLFFAFVVGIGPSLIEIFTKLKIKTRANRFILQKKKEQAIARAQDEVSEQ